MYKKPLLKHITINLSNMTQAPAQHSQVVCLNPTGVPDDIGQVHLPKPAKPIT